MSLPKTDRLDRTTAKLGENTTTKTAAEKVYSKKKRAILTSSADVTEALRGLTGWGFVLDKKDNFTCGLAADNYHYVINKLHGAGIIVIPQDDYLESQILHRINAEISIDPKQPGFLENINALIAKQSPGVRSR